MSRWLLMFSVVPLFLGCTAARTAYRDPLGPRFSGAVSSEPRGAETGASWTGPAEDALQDTLTIVTFNVKFAVRVDSAIRVLRELSAAYSIDVLFLQEMDAPGTEAIARALDLNFVYYPATVHPLTQRDFGNAILSRYLLEDDRKIVLPYTARFRKTPRVAVSANIRVNGQRVRVYSVHFATLIDNRPSERLAQLATVLADANGSEPVIIGGDFNSASLASAATSHGFDWATRHIGRTMQLWSLDHVLLRGVAPPADSQLGVVRDIHGASDHRPVWVRVALPRAVVAN
jgi:endonuclease/exonuclease/phosphatase family metal-dependent hydrolase